MDKAVLRHFLKAAAVFTLAYLVTLYLFPLLPGGSDKAEEQIGSEKAAEFCLAHAGQLAAAGTAPDCSCVGRAMTATFSAAELDALIGRDHFTQGDLDRLKPNMPDCLPGSPQ